MSTGQNSALRVWAVPKVLKKGQIMDKIEMEERAKRIEWFTNARFGMFIHWGLYAIPARGEWLRSHEEMSIEDYQGFFDEFNPVDYNPKKWAKLAKQAGMKYAVLTAKHHDGFCLFDSQLTEYKATNTPAARDLVKEFVEAFRAEDIKVGLYFSVIDWYHPDFPHFGDAQHPMRNNLDYKDKSHNFDNYLDYMHGQIREICTNYGKLDILWFDFSYGKMSGETWRATELVQMVRKLQPTVLIDNRLEVSGEGFGSLRTDNPTVYSGDFVSPEQIIPPKGVLNVHGKPIPWEACLTMNNNWGYSQFDKDFYSAETIIKKLVECVSKGGNMLLNVGPDALGNIPQESVDILQAVGKWMHKNGDSIYNCGYADFPKPDYGRITASKDGKNIYIHVMEQTIGPVPIEGIKKEQIKRVRLLATGAELSTENTWVTNNYPNYVFVRLDRRGLASYQLPDSTDTVIKLELEN